MPMFESEMATSQENSSRVLSMAPWTRARALDLLSSCLAARDYTKCLYSD